MPAPSKTSLRLRHLVRSRYHSLRRKFLEKFNREKYLEEAVYTSWEADDPDWESQGELQYLQTTKWMKRGRKVNVSAAEIPLPEGSDTHWVAGNSGEQYLSWDVLRRYRKLVEDAEYETARRRREGKELWVKYLTMAAAILAALASLGNLYLLSHHTH